MEARRNKIKIKFKLSLVFFTFIFLLLTLPKTISAHAQVVVVEMTAWGFQPQSIALDNNSTVIFINKDSQAHWPASDVHPTHDLYPEFDPQKGIAPGQSWPFRPKKVGVWRFHDHLFPHFNGTLTVTSENGTVQTDKNWVENFKETVSNIFIKVLRTLSLSKVKPLTKEDFAKLSSKEQIKNIQTLSESIGSEESWNYIKDTYRGQAGSSGNIHDLAHLAGNLLYLQKGLSGLKSCSPDFAFGCYHGFLDEAFRKNLDHLSDAQQACLGLGKEGSGPVGSCIHGIGHGVASFYSTTDLKKALATCRKLPSGSEFCFDGVFMEFVRSAPENFFKKSDFLYPCDDLEKEFGYTYSFACGRNQPALLVSRFQLGFDDVSKICLNSDSSPFKEACVNALGFSVAESGDTQQIIGRCGSIGGEEFVKSCAKAAAGELVFQNVPNWDAKSKAICNSLTDAKECLSYVERLVSDYHRVRE